MASKMAQKLGTSVPSVFTTTALLPLAEQITANFEQFRYLCERDTFYIVALAQQANKQERKK
jgi:hypothetical protein